MLDKKWIILPMMMSFSWSGEWTLKKTLSQVMSQSEEIEIIRTEEEKGQAQIDEFVGYTLPNVNFNTSATFINNSSQAQAAMFGLEDLSSIFGPEAGGSTDRLGGMQYSWRLGVSQTLNVFRITSTKAMADTQEKIIGAQVDQSKEELISKAVNVYHDAWKANQDLEVAKELLENQQELAKIMETELRFGRVSSLDQRRIQAAVKLNQAEFNQKKASLENAVQAMRDLLKLSKSDEVTFAEEEDLQFLESGIQSNPQQNNGMKLMNLSADLTEQNASYQYSFFFPSLNLEASASNQFVGYDDKKFSVLDKYADPEYFNYSMGVSLQWNLFNGWTTTAQYDQLETEARIQRRKISLMEKEIARSQIAAFEMLSVGKEVYLAAQEMRLITKESLTKDQKDFQEGRLRLTDLNNTEKEYKEAFQTETNARANYVNALVQYRIIAGLGLEGGL